MSLSLSRLVSLSSLFVSRRCPSLLYPVCLHWSLSLHTPAPFSLPCSRLPPLVSLTTYTTGAVLSHTDDMLMYDLDYDMNSALFSNRSCWLFYFFVVDELCLVVVESDVDGRDNDSDEEKVKSVVLNNGNNADLSGKRGQLWFSWWWQRQTRDNAVGSAW
ncbi:hypothetical protein ACFE04_007404 [Oxalis oulophora]